MSSISVDAAAKYLQGNAPEVWQAVYVKHIDAPGSHYGFKAVAVALASGIHEMTLRERSMQMSNVAAAASLMQRHGYPTYYVSGTLIQALQHITLKDLTWEDIVWPYDSLMFMIPRGTLHESPTGAEIVMVGVARLPRESLKVPGLNVTVSGSKNWTTDRITVFWCLGPSCLEVQCCTFPITQSLEPSPEWIDQKTREFVEATEYKIKDWPAGEFSSYMCGIAANLLLMMQARKDLVESGARTKKRLGNGTPVYSPNYIGRKYQIMRKERSKEAGAHFTELGWRAGCARRQHYGPGNSQVKIVIIEPYTAFVRGLVRNP